MVMMYTTDLLEEGRFDVTLSDGKRIRPSEWVTKLKTVSLNQSGYLEKARMPDVENELFEVPIGEGPYYLRIDLMNALIIPGVVMYNSNGIGKLNAMRENDGCELDESGIYGAGKKPAYDKTRVLKMAEELGIMANAQLPQYQIPPNIVMNVIGFIFSDVEDQLDRMKIVIPSGCGSFVSLSKDITGWPLEAFLIDLVSMEKSDWTDEYTGILKILLLVMMSGMCETVQREETTASEVGYEMRVVGEYSKNSLAQRSLSITYDVVRIQYVAKFCQFLEKQLERLHGDDVGEAMDELQQKFLLDAYNIIESPLSGSAWVLEKVRNKIGLLLSDMNEYKTDLAMVMRLLRVKQIKINEYVDSIDRVVRKDKQDVSPFSSRMIKKPQQVNRDMRTPVYISETANYIVTEVGEDSDASYEPALNQNLYGFSGTEMINSAIFGGDERRNDIQTFNKRSSKYNTQILYGDDKLVDDVDHTSENTQVSRSSKIPRLENEMAKKSRNIETDSNTSETKSLGSMRRRIPYDIPKDDDKKEEKDEEETSVIIEQNDDDVKSTVTFESIVASIP